MAGRSDGWSRRTTFAVLSVVTVFAVGALLVRVSGNGPAHPGRDRRSAAQTRRLAATGGGSGSQGRTRSPRSDQGSGKQGAVSAAVAYATGSQRWLYLTDDQIRAAIAEIATPTAASRLTADVVATVSTARDQLRRSSGRVWWLVRPLAWRVDDLGGRQAQVSVWTVTVLSAAGVAAPQSDYVTVTVDLAWVDGRWRVEGARDTPGPTPITGPHDQPWDAEPFDRALAGFARIDSESSR